MHISINDVDSGNSIISELNVPSNLIGRRLVPLNIKPEGVNNIQVSLVNEERWKLTGLPLNKVMSLKIFHLSVYSI